MRWERLFADLEAQAAAAQAATLTADVADRTRGELADIPLLARLRGSLGAVLSVDAVGDSITGRLVRVGADWLLLETDPGGRCALVPVAALASLIGLPLASLDESADPIGARLGLRAALRVLARDRAEVVVVLRSSVRHRGVVERVGADAFDVGVRSSGERRASTVLTIPFASAAVVWSG